MKQVRLGFFGLLIIGLWAGAICADDGRFIFLDLTVKDNNTGLIWIRNGNLGRQSRDGANKLVEELNRNKYAGHEDWRLPTAKELESLVKYAKSLGYDRSPKGPYKLFNEMGFYDVQSSIYWSSSTSIFMTFSGGSWGVSMDNGSSDYNNKTNKINIWPVREDI
jgi:hypothetical protein